MIEHLFGTLKGQFRRLKNCLDVSKVDDVAVLSIALCILHSMAIIHQEDIFDFIDDIDQGNDDDDYVSFFPANRQAEDKRRDIVNLLRRAPVN